MIKSKKSKLIPREYDEVILKTGELVGLMDQVDETHFYLIMVLKHLSKKRKQWLWHQFQLMI